MGTDPIAAKTEFLLLNETQSAAFDTEFHTFDELEAKFAILQKLVNEKIFYVLDIGGGNGLFADQFLGRFSKAIVTVLDVSSLLLSRNKPSSRKQLVHGSIENISDLLEGRTFDYITANWVLHHLVGNSYRASRGNCLKTLRRCKELLKPNGILIIAENMFDGYLRSNLPSHLIYAITRIKWRWFVRLTKRFFNTAGVGVCFQSQRAWRRMFAEAGFEVVAFERGLVWWWLRTFPSWGVHLLFVKSISHGHFFLKPSER